MTAASATAMKAVMKAINANGHRGLQTEMTITKLKE